MKNKKFQSYMLGSIHRRILSFVTVQKTLRLSLILSFIFLLANGESLSAAARIFEHPHDQTVPAGETVLLRVKALSLGNSSLDFQWVKDGMILDHANEATLKLANLQPPMEGLYSVIITDESGSIASKKALVAVARPFFMEDFEDGNSGDGNPVKWVANLGTSTGSTGTVIDGSYVFTTAGSGSAEADEPALIGDVSIRTIIRGITRSGNNGTIVVYARQQPRELEGESYWGAVTPLGLHVGMNTGRNSRIILGTLVDPLLNPFTGDRNVQFDVVGKKMTLTVWSLGSTMPSKPQLTKMAPTSLPSGRIGFNTNARQIAIRSFNAIRIGGSVSPALRWENLGGNILRFNVPIGFVLQSSPTVNSPEWSVIDGSGSIDVNAAAPFRFFRLFGQ